MGTLPQENFSTKNFPRDAFPMAQNVASTKTLRIRGPGGGGWGRGFHISECSPSILRLICCGPR